MMRFRRGVTHVLSSGLLGLLLIALAFPSVGETTPSAAGKVTASPAADADLLATTRTEINFPSGMRFLVEFPSPNGFDPSTLTLRYQAGDLENWNLVLVQPNSITTDPDGSVAAEVDVNLQAASIPTGIPITFQWQATSNDLTPIRSAPETTDWYDNRYDWIARSSDQVDLHYFGLADDFADEILTTAQSTITDLESTYSLDRSRKLQLWIYPDVESFRGSLPANSRDTVAGGSFIGYSLIVAVIPDGMTSEIGRIVPHEVSHQVLYQATWNPFTILPVWFDEGMATHIQVGGTSTYMGTVINALNNNALFDLSSLSAGFPFVPSQATLAYAASWSAIAYIEATYGEEGIARLIAGFGTGAPVNQVIEDALGVSMDDFNRQWKEWIGSQS